MDSDSFGLIVIIKDFIKDSKNSEDLFEFIILNENHELFRNKNKKILGKFELETLKNNLIYESVCSRSKV